jgi:hypothetical protein
MLLQYKAFSTAVIFSALVTIATITAPFTSMFGKHYSTQKDFVCCKANHLISHHYFTVNVFWITVDTGYTEENIGDSKGAVCNITCDN